VFLFWNIIRKYDVLLWGRFDRYADLEGYLLFTDKNERARRVYSILVLMMTMFWRVKWTLRVGGVCHCLIESLIVFSLIISEMEIMNSENIVMINGIMFRIDIMHIMWNVSTYCYITKFFQIKNFTFFISQFLLFLNVESIIWVGFLALPSLHFIVQSNRYYFIYFVGRRYNSSQYN